MDEMKDRKMDNEKERLGEGKNRVGGWGLGRG